PNVNEVGVDFLRTVGMTLLAGREFEPRDTVDAPKVAVVNEAFAHYFYKTESPIGRRFSWGRNDKDFVEIVGLVRDGKEKSLREPPPPSIHTPLAQAEIPAGATFSVRTAGPPAAIASALRATVAAADPGVPVTDMKTMERQVDEALFIERLVAGLSAAFGLLA